MSDTNHQSNPMNQSESVERNKASARRFITKLWQEHDMAVIPELFSPDVRVISPLNRTGLPLKIEDIYRKWTEAFPDLIFKIHYLLGEGDRVVFSWTATGTHLGSFFDTSPSHQEISYSGITTLIFNEAGDIVVYDALVDMHAILAQLMEYESIAEVVE